MGVKFKFNLGDRLKDRVTGFEGIVMSRTEWLTGCNTYGLKSQVLKDGLPTDSQWVDEVQLDKVDRGVNIVKAKKPLGGPQETPKMGRS